MNTTIKKKVSIILLLVIILVTVVFIVRSVSTDSNSITAAVSKAFGLTANSSITTKEQPIRQTTVLSHVESEFNHDTAELLVEQYFNPKISRSEKDEIVTKLKTEGEKVENRKNQGGIAEGCVSNAFANIVNGPPPPKIDVDDLLAVINGWGTPGNPIADIAPKQNGNGHVNVDDLLAVINSWGPVINCPVTLLPNYQERAVLTLTNAVRVAPTQYDDVYLPAGNGNLLSSSTPKNPVYWNMQLNVAAQNHAIDMATNNYFSHTSQNGMTWIQRIAAAGYTGSPTGENIAAGYQDPISVMTGWILSIGHQQNLMSTFAKELGVGYAINQNSSYVKYWVQDFGSRNFTVTSPIVSGSHIYPSSGNIRFLINIDDPATPFSPPQAVNLVLDSVNYPMTLHMGVADKGTYEKTMSSGTTCRAYYFNVTSATGGAFRYPETGKLYTYGEGGCTQDYSL